MTFNILIYGAGAIGRGYLPWILSKKAKISYVEDNLSLVNYFNRKKNFYSLMIKNKKYIKKKIFFEKIYRFGEEIKFINNFDLIILCAGTRNVDNISNNLINFKNKILVLENDLNSTDYLKQKLNKKNIFFGIPDVISSNTASKKIKKKYGEKTIITENGICYLEKKIEVFFDKAVFLNKKKLHEQWICKLYLHNTVHCILAYLGHIVGFKYLHEIANLNFSKKILNQCFSEISNLLLLRYKIDIKTIKYYSKKEFYRFTNKLLFDPIDRVAREPFRKLKIDERLIGAANKCISIGIYPKTISFGIFCAFNYKNRNDPDYNISYLLNALNKEDFLEIAIGLRKNEPLSEILLENWDLYSKHLKNLKKLK
jgi:mannitol-1-phosphate 5-dehydrogenase